jgi:tRNA-specific 2-thiouridylase
MNSKRVVVGLSGGVDSSSAAYLLLKQGFSVVGVTLLTPGIKASAVKRAQAVARKLNIEHFSLPLEDSFKEKIFPYFINSYLRGFTPNPCCFCNRWLKLPALIEASDRYGCGHVATGHFISLIKEEGRFYLQRSAAGRKSQEYFLSLVPAQNLSRLLFPLAKYNKQQIIDRAQKENFYPWPVTESQEICFIPGSNYKKFIRQHINNSVDYTGKIKYYDGRVLGRHQGVYNFTYGQRSGLGISWSEPLYVIKIDPQTRDIVVAPRELLYRSQFRVINLNWFAPAEDYQNINVRIRYNSQLLPVSIKQDKQSLQVRFTGRKAMPTPGQIAVFYQQQRVIAAGVIDYHE